MAEVLDRAAARPTGPGMFDTVTSTLFMHTPLYRFIWGLGAGYAFQALVKPSVSYLDENTEKPFALAVDDEFYDVSTYFPWFMWPLLFGIIFGVFV